MIIEHTLDHTARRVTKLDPFGIEPHALPYALLVLCEGRYGVTKVVRRDYEKKNSPIWIFVVERFH